MISIFITDHIIDVQLWRIIALITVSLFFSFSQQILIASSLNCSTSSKLGVNSGYSFKR